MSQTKNVKANYLWNLVFQLFLIIVPLIVTPYVSRILGSDGIGKYSFSFSLNYYFTLLALLGFNYYAQREIAKHQNDRTSQTKLFWEIVIVRSISTLLALAIYSGLILSNVFKDYNTLLWIMGLNIVAIMFDPAFLFQGNEEFKQITIRNVIVKVLVIVSIFLFVRKPSDLWVYTLINSLNPIITAIVLIPFIKKYVGVVKIKELQPFKHVIPTLRLFIPTIAISVYAVLDKTMIGIIVKGNTTVIEDGIEIIKKTSDLENGYYEQSDKIIKFVMTVVTSLSAVMIPRNASVFAEKNYEQLHKNIYTAVRFTLLLAIPMTFGLLAISKNFCPWFFGPGYDKVPFLIMILSPLIILIGCSGVFGLQYLIPIGKDMLFTLSVVVGAVVNFGLNIVLIMYLQSYGAAIASVVAELSVLVAQLIIVRKKFSVKKILNFSWKYFLSGLFMFAIIYPVSLILASSIINTILLVILGCIIYFCLLFAFNDDFVVDFSKKIRNKIIH